MNTQDLKHLTEDKQFCWRHEKNKKAKKERVTEILKINDNIIRAYTNGGSREEKTTRGFIIKQKLRIIQEVTSKLEPGSSAQAAEVSTVFEALKWLHDQGHTDVVLIVDSHYVCIGLQED